MFVLKREPLRTTGASDTGAVCLFLRGKKGKTSGCSLGIGCGEADFLVYLRMELGHLGGFFLRLFHFLPPMVSSPPQPSGMPFSNGFHSYWEEDAALRGSEVVDLEACGK